MTLWVFGSLVGFGVWALLVAYGNLSAHPAEPHEPNDYGERRRTS